MKSAVDESSDARLGVTIEAEFTVAEYDIVILSAKDSGGLDKWLRKNEYNIPKGANAVLRPYVEQNTKFFVAKVDSKKVKFRDGKAVLSPLRFHYDAPTFTLPVRLGLLNSAGITWASSIKAVRATMVTARRTSPCSGSNAPATECMSGTMLVSSSSS